jgi:hypothetical protein
MKTNKSRKPSNSIKTLSTVLQCSSLSTFLIVGLSAVMLKMIVTKLGAIAKPQ